MQSTLTDLAHSSARQRAAGGDAVAVARTWSDVVRGLLDGPLAATGSVGRGEATPLSDIDVIRLSPGPTPALDRLQELGRVDENGVTSDTRSLPGTESSWRATATEWADHPERDLAVVKMGLLADAAHPVRRAAAEAVPGSRMIPEMLRDSLSVSAPKLGLRRWSRTAVAIKDQLLTPLVKLARWGALSSGSDELSTLGRLASVSPFALSRGESSDLADVFTVVFGLRLDLDLGLVDQDCVDHHGRILLPRLPRDRATSVISAAATLRGVQKAARYRLTTSSYAPGNSRSPRR